MSKRKLSMKSLDINERRAAWAEVAINAFMGVCRTDEEDALCDLLADLRHWAKERGYDYAAEDGRADHHFAAETADQEKT